MSSLHEKLAIHGKIYSLDRHHPVYLFGEYSLEWSYLEYSPRGYSPIKQLERYSVSGYLPFRDEYWTLIEIKGMTRVYWVHLVNLKMWVPLLKRWVSFGCGTEKVGITRVEKVVPTFLPPTLLGPSRYLVPGECLSFNRCRMSRCLMFGFVSESSCMYACMIPSPDLFYMY